LVPVAQLLQMAMETMEATLFLVLLPQLVVVLVVLTETQLEVAVVLVVLVVVVDFAKQLPHRLEVPEHFLKVIQAALVIL
jgi:hypothetical protein